MEYVSIISKIVKLQNKVISDNKNGIKKNEWIFYHQRDEFLYKIKGEGYYVIKKSDRCTSCKGNKVTKESEIKKIPLDKDDPDRKRYTFERESDEMNGYEPRRCNSRKKIKKHNFFWKKDII